jgi:periplasmic protein TonB
MSQQEENRNKQKAGMYSLAVHSALLILFFFLIVWKEPNPPHPEYGIELNFGLDNVGSGDNQNTTPANNSQKTEDSKPEESAKSEPVEEITPQPVESNTENIKVADVNPVESPVFEEEKPKKVTETKPVNKEKEVAKVKTENKVVEKETKTDGAQGKDGQTSEAKASNQGDNKEKVGDKGDPKGSLDSRALYGTQGGGGGGASLEMAGWVWDFKPRPKDDSNESGRIVFEIVIDDQGEIISVRTIERTVSPAIEKIYRQEVEKLTFSKTSDNTIPAPRSSGRITFIIRSK